MCCFLLVLCADSPGQSADPLLARAEDLRLALASRDEAALKSCTSATFLDLMPPGSILDWVTRAQESYGRIEKVRMRRALSASLAMFEFTTAKGYALPAWIEIERSGRLISSMGFAAPWRHFASREEIRLTADPLGETTAIYAAELTKDGLGPSLDIRGSEGLSVASMMKLYILVCLVEDIAAGKRSWNDAIELREEDRSTQWSSGVMHTWPAGTQVSLQAAAALMIGESDNTAADMLLHRLGRDRVEAALKSCGHAHPERNAPYLSTAEVWKLKYYRRGELGYDYAALENDARAAYLEREVAPIRLRDTWYPRSGQPTLVGSVGWFASAKDIALAFRRIWELSKSDPNSTALRILGIKGSSAFPEGFFDYLGGKSGRDHGVLCAGYIARADDRWYVVVCITNAHTQVPEDRFWEFARGVVATAGRPLGE